MAVTHSADEKSALQDLVEAPLVGCDGQLEVALGLVDRLLLLRRRPAVPTTTGSTVHLGSWHASVRPSVCDLVAGCLGNFDDFDDFVLL